MVAFILCLAMRQPLHEFMGGHRIESCNAILAILTFWRLSLISIDKVVRIRNLRIQQREWH